MAERRLLFISHEATRTGAPILLLNFLGWLKTESKVAFDILLRDGGPLESDFRAVAPVIVLPHSSSGSTVERAWTRLLRRRQLRRIVSSRPSLIYSNTVTNGSVLAALSGAACPVISHIHELEPTISNCGVENFANVRRHSTRFVACAEAVKANLVDNHGITPEQIDVVHEFIPIDGCIDRQRAKQALVEELGLGPDAFVVGTAGTMGWRKSPELFVQLASAIARKRPNLPVHFVWVGADQAGRRYEELMYDVLHVGLAPRIHFLSSRPNPVQLFAAFDVFALVSREDPFPLVCLEAASVGTPLLCFDGAGGEKEFVEQDCGFVVPYLDVNEMADRAVTLLESEDVRRRYGDRAMKKVRQRHDVNVAAPTILRVIERQLRD
jgi:glycosyltransferase involved in cell wall biosynthesis